MQLYLEASSSDGNIFDMVSEFLSEFEAIIDTVTEYVSLPFDVGWYVMRVVFGTVEFLIEQVTYLPAPLLVFAMGGIVLSFAYVILTLVL